MKKEEKITFVDLFAEYYEKFFNSTAEAVDLLADIQKKFPMEYQSIQEFSVDSHSIENLIDDLPPEKQNILLKILLRAGKFGKQMVNLFESTIEEKKQLSKDLKKFADELTKEIKTVTKK